MKVSKPRKKGNDQLLAGMVIFGLLILFFSVGKSLIDVMTQPLDTIDLVEDDRLEAGFLPVYAEENSTADADLVAVGGTAVYEPVPAAGEAGPTPTPDPGLAPERILIPVIDLDAPVIPIGFEELVFGGERYQQWLAPSTRAAGWHKTSVGLGAVGNTVLNGHHNIYGEVFRDLYRLESGDQIDIVSGEQTFHYVVVYVGILPERNQPLEVRLENSEWIQSTDDERITLITCWPYESNTHRVIVVAVPASISTTG